MKTLHVIAHSHLDREWYMPFEAHRYRLIKLIDDVLDLMKDDDFKYFHLDGHVIPIYDYIEIKPERKDELLMRIKEDRIQIGPWYILQDAFLTSGESNIRNLITGLQLSKELGAKPLMTGYFPDTFGNISQAPQILKGFGITSAVFGRGLNEINFNNEVARQTDPSEIIWKSPDGSEVTAAMFSNWYCNAMDLPETDDEIKERFESIIRNTKRFSKINHLLAMNGCDHSPVQKNLTEIIKKAQNQIPNVNIIHSNFKDYLKEVEKNKNKYDTVLGEINGQYTSGYGLLINTASSRIDIKKLNHKAQVLLEREVEILNSLNFVLNNRLTENEFMPYAWQTLMKNHAHDSICTCSIDEVHAEVISRLNRVIQLSDTLKNEGMQVIVNGIDSNNYGVVVFNKDIYQTTSLVDAEVVFGSSMKIDEFKLFDGEKEIPFTYTKKINQFHYELPDDSFRKVSNVTKFNISFIATDVPPVGYKTYKISLDTPSQFEGFNFDNGMIKLEFNENGTYNIYDYQIGKTYKNQHYFEYTADVGNEYNYEQSQENFIFNTLNETPKMTVLENNYNRSVMRLEYSLLLPKGVNDKKIIDEKSIIKITTDIILERFKNQVEHQTTINNINSENFRIRAIFPHELDTKVVYSEGHFDLVKRNVIPPKTWKNPSNAQRLEHFVLMEDYNDGLIVATRGIHEYEALYKKEQAIAITLLRAVGELGDWGYFPTPKSQMQGSTTLSYALGYFNKQTKHEAIQEAYRFNHMPLITKMIKPNKGIHQLSFSLFGVDNPNLSFSSLKVSENKKGIILRIYNITDISQTAIFSLNNLIQTVYETKIDETIIKEETIYKNTIKITVSPKEIKTYLLK